MRKSNSIQITVHQPGTSEGRSELAKRIADIHADAVLHCLRALNCPSAQKLALLDAVIASCKERPGGKGQ